MRKENIPIIAKECLSSFINDSGGILYSSHETLVRGSVYLLGFNPGGSGGCSLEKDIDSMLLNTSNSYIDESWSNRNGSWEPGEAPLQKRVTWLLGEIGVDPRTVCASNLIFLRSRAASDVSYSLAEACWPVHQSILEIVKPRLIIAFGNSDRSPYGYLREMLAGKEDKICSGHGNWKAKGFAAKINGRNVYIAGIPHLSRYSPKGKDEVIGWLKRHLRAE